MRRRFLASVLAAAMILTSCPPNAMMISGEPFFEDPDGGYVQEMQEDQLPEDQAFFEDHSFAEDDPVTEGDVFAEGDLPAENDSFIEDVSVIEPEEDPEGFADWLPEDEADLFDEAVVPDEAQELYTEEAVFPEDDGEEEYIQLLPGEEAEVEAGSSQLYAVDITQAGYYEIVSSSGLSWNNRYLMDEEKNRIASEWYEDIQELAYALTPGRYYIYASNPADKAAFLTLHRFSYLTEGENAVEVYGSFSVTYLFTAPEDEPESAWHITASEEISNGSIYGKWDNHHLGYVTDCLAVISPGNSISIMASGRNTAIGTIRIERKKSPQDVHVRCGRAFYYVGEELPGMNDFSVSYRMELEDGTFEERTLSGTQADEDGNALSGYLELYNADGERIWAYSPSDFTEPCTLTWKVQFAGKYYSGSLEMVDRASMENDYAPGETLAVDGGIEETFIMTLKTQSYLSFRANDAADMTAQICAYDRPQEMFALTNTKGLLLDRGTYTLTVRNNEAQTSYGSVYPLKEVSVGMQYKEGLSEEETLFTFLPESTGGEKAGYSFTAYSGMNGVIRDQSGNVIGLLRDERAFAAVLTPGQMYYAGLYMIDPDQTGGSLDIREVPVPENVTVRLHTDPLLAGVSVPSAEDFTVEYDYVGQGEEADHRVLIGAQPDENGYRLSDPVFYTGDGNERIDMPAGSPGTYPYEISFAGEIYSGEAQFADPQDLLENYDPGTMVSIPAGSALYFRLTASAQEAYYCRAPLGMEGVSVTLRAQGESGQGSELSEEDVYLAPAGEYTLTVINGSAESREIYVETARHLQPGANAIGTDEFNKPMLFHAGESQDSFAWYKFQALYGSSVTICDAEGNQPEIRRWIYDVLAALEPGSPYIVRVSGGSQGTELDIDSYVPPANVRVEEVPVLYEHYDSLSVYDLKIKYENESGVTRTVSLNTYNPEPFCSVQEAYFADDEGNHLGEVHETGIYTAHIRFFDSWYTAPVRIEEPEYTLIQEQGVYPVTSTSAAEPDRFCIAMDLEDDYDILSTEWGMGFLRPGSSDVYTAWTGLHSDKDTLFYFSAYRNPDEENPNGEDDDRPSSSILVRYHEEVLDAGLLPGTEAIWNGDDLTPQVKVNNKYGQPIDSFFYSVKIYDSVTNQVCGECIEPGLYTFKIAGRHQYSGLSSALSFEILPCSLAGASIEMTASPQIHTYDTAPFVPQIGVLREEKSVNPAEYVLTWRNEENGSGGAFSDAPSDAGMYAAAVSGSQTGHYTDTREVSFEIRPADLAEIREAGTLAVPDPDPVRYFEDPEQIVFPRISLNYMGMDLEEDKDYTVEFTDYDHPGTAKAIVCGTGNFTGSIEVPFSLLDTAVPAEEADAVALTGNMTFGYEETDQWAMIPSDKETWVSFDMEGERGALEEDEPVLYRLDSSGEYWMACRTWEVSAQEDQTTDRLHLHAAFLFDSGTVAVRIPARFAAAVRTSIPVSQGDTLPLTASEGDEAQIYRLDTQADWRYVLSSEHELTLIEGSVSSGEWTPGNQMTGRRIFRDLLKGSIFAGISRSDGESGGSFSFDAVPAPSAVQGLRAGAELYGSSLHWNRTYDDVEEYRIYRYTGDWEEESGSLPVPEDETSGWEMAALISDPAVTSWKDTGLEGKQAYTYYIRTCSGIYLKSPASEMVCVTTLADEEAPSLAGITPLNGSTISGDCRFSLQVRDNIAPASAVMEYTTDFLAEPQDAQWVRVAEASAPDTQQECTFVFDWDTTLTQAEKARVRFRMTDVYGNSAYSSVVYQYAIDNIGPAKVKNLRYTATSTVITLAWDDVPDEDLAYFAVEKKTGEDTWERIGKAENRLGYYIRGLMPETGGTYRVAAFDRCGNRGEASDEITAMTDADVTAPVVSAISPDPCRVRGVLQVTFTLSDDVGVKTLLVQTSADALEWTDRETIALSGSGTVMTVSWNLDTDTYPEGSVYVRAVPTDYYGNEGNSSSSAPYTEYYIDRTPPAVPSGFYGEYRDGLTVLSWDQGSEADLAGYTLERREEGDAAFAVIAAGLASLSYTDTGVDFEKAYQYRLKVSDEVGNESGYTEDITVFVPKDEEKPKVWSVSPSEGEVLGRNSEIRAAVGDNGSVASVKSTYKADGGDWVSLPDLEINSRYEVCTLDVKPAEAAVSSFAVRIWCVDAAGNQSSVFERSWQVDQTPPNEPHLTAGLEGWAVSLRWTCGSEEIADDLAGFYVCRKTASGGEGFAAIGSVSATGMHTDGAGNDYTFLDKNTAEASTYVYCVTAVDINGNRAESNEVTVAVPEGVKKPDTVSPEAIIYGNTVVEKGVSVRFDGSASRDDTAVTGWEWRFGDDAGDDSQPDYADDWSVSHVFETEGTFTVTLTVRDAAGNTGSAQIRVNVVSKRETGTLLVHVIDENGSPVPEAGVYFDLGDESMTVVRTDAQGLVELTAGEGVHPVGVYKDGYLPESREAAVEADRENELTIMIEQKNIVVGELKTHRMTLEEIIDAKLDPEDEANQNVYEFTLKLTYRKTELTYKGMLTESNYILTPPRKERIGDREIEICMILPDHIPGEGFADDLPKDEWNPGTTQEVIPTVAILDIPGTAAWMKDFFDVELVIVNQADSRFTLDECEAKLDVPVGLSLVASERTGISETVSMGSVTGGTSAAAEWILRADEPGEYSLSAEFSAVLRSFQARVAASFEASEPIVVRNGDNLWLDIVTENGILEYVDGAMKVGLRNEDPEPVYCPVINLEKVYPIRTYKTKGNSQVDTDMHILSQGEEIWTEYLIHREDWDVLSDYEDTTFGLTQQILKKLKGLNINVSFSTLQPMSISPDRIFVNSYDSGTQEIGPELQIVECRKDGMNSASLPDMMIRTTHLNEEGVEEPASMEVTIHDGYLSDYGDEDEKDGYTITTNEDGEYILPGHEISHFWDVWGEDHADNSASYKAFTIAFNTRRALKKVSCVARGRFAEVGRHTVYVYGSEESGEFKLLNGASVTLNGSTEETHDGKVSYSAVPTGENSISISAQGYDSFYGMTAVGDDSIEKFVLYPSESGDHSRITQVSNTVSVNRVGNMIVIPKGTIEGRITFTLDRWMAEGETFENYSFRVTDKDGNEKEGDAYSGTFTGSTFWIDLAYLDPGDVLSFALHVKLSDGRDYVSGWRDASLLILESPGFFGRLGYNLSQFSNSPLLEMAGTPSISFDLLSQDYSFSEVDATGTSHWEEIQSNSKAKVMHDLHKQMWIGLDEKVTYNLDASYDLSGKLILSVSRNQVDENGWSVGSWQHYSTLMNNGPVQVGVLCDGIRLHSSKLKCQQKAAVDFIFSYEPTEDRWYLTVEAVIQPVGTYELFTTPPGLLLANAAWTAKGNIRLQLFRTPVGNHQTLAEIAELPRLKEASAGGDIEVRFGGKLGTEDLGAIGAYGRLGFEWNVLPFGKLELEETLGWFHKILFFEEKEHEWFHQKQTFLENTFRSSSSHRLAGEDTDEMVSEDSALYAAVSDHSSWIGGEDLLAQDVYYDAEPQTAVLSDGRILLVYSDYNDAADAGNPVGVFYSIYDGTGWSAPACVNEPENQGTIGLYPRLKAVEGGAELTWMNMTEALTGKTSFSYEEIREEVYPKMGVASAFFDEQDNTWKNRRMYANGRIVSSPDSARNPSGTMHVWITNASNLENGDAQSPQTIMYHFEPDGGSAAEGELTLPEPVITHVSVDSDGDGFVLLAECCSEDGSVLVRRSVFADGCWTQAAALAEEGENLFSPLYAAGSTWFIQDGRIMRMEGKYMRQAVCDPSLQGATCFRAAPYGENGVVLAWIGSQNGNCIMAAVSEDGRVFGKPFAAAEPEGMPLHLEISKSSRGWKITYLDSIITAAGEETKPRTLIKTADIVTGADIAVVSVESSSYVYDGARLSTAFTVENHGLQAVDELQVFISTDPDGRGPIASANVSGTSGVLEWTVPEGGGAQTWYLTALPADAAVADTDLRNNAMPILASLTDLALISASYEGDDDAGTHFIFSVKNQGVTNCEEPVLFMTDLETDEVVCETHMDPIPAGAGADLEVILEREAQPGSWTAQIGGFETEIDMANNRRIISVNIVTQIASKDVHVHVPGETITENEVEASCTKGGSYDRAAYCEKCHEEVFRETVKTDPLGHLKDVYAAAAKPSAGAEGHIAYWQCARGCGSIFANTQEKQEMTQEDLSALNAFWNAACNLPDPAGMQIGDAGAVAAAKEAAARLREDQLSMLGDDVRGLLEQKLESAVRKIAQLEEAEKKAKEEADAKAKAEADAKAKAAEQEKAEAARAQEEAQQAEAARIEAEKAKFALNVKPGAKNIPIQLKKTNKKIMAVSLGEGDVLLSAVSSAPAFVRASVSGRRVVLKGLKDKKKAAITVTTKLGAVISFSVKVQKAKVTTKKITASKNVTVAVGGTLDLGPMLINPVTTGDRTSFKTASKKIASVTGKGVIKGRKKGKTKITIKSGTKKKVITVTVK